MIPILSDVPGPIVDYPFDTTRNAVHMVFNGVLDNYPSVRIILSHAGGFVPFAVARFCELRHSLDASGPPPEELLNKFKHFYWDTALSAGHAAFGSLLELADHGRILFGSDFPYASNAVASRFTEILDRETGLSADLLRAINVENVRDLLPRTGQLAPAASPGYRG
jgi:aminocarboxymuconate-semialdehyde decarboxylase